MRTGRAVLASLILLILAGVAVPAHGLAGTLSPAGKSFIKDAASAGLVEVQLGQVASDKGSSQEVKDFGGLMVRDHGKANEELKALAALRNLKLPVQVERKHTLMIAKLSEFSGNSFDRKYLQAMVMHHSKNIARFKKAINRVKDQDLNAWAVSTLPLLQQHLQLAKEMLRNLGRR